MARTGVSAAADAEAVGQFLDGHYVVTSPPSIVVRA